MRLLITYLVTLFITFYYCYGQNNQRVSVSQKPANTKQILQKAAKACLKIKTIKYTEDHFHTDHGDKVPLLTAAVRQGKANVPDVGFSPGKFIIEGKIKGDTEQFKFAYSYDGKSFRVLDAAEKVVQVVKSPTPYIAGQVLAETGQVGFPQFTQNEPFKFFLEKGENFTCEGIRLVNGTGCDVVSFILTVEFMKRKGYVYNLLLGGDDVADL